MNSTSNINEKNNILEVKNLSKSFPGVKAVDNLSFSIKKGEIIGMVGPNGAGKTTSIECIVTIASPDSGDIHISGHNLYNNPEKAKAKLGYVPEVPLLLFPELTVIENIQFSAKAYSYDDWENKAEKYLKMFDLEEKKDSAINGLSKGQKQKTAIICAFIHEPDLIIFDEPIIGIDPKGVRTLRNLIIEHKKRGGSALISSHILGIVEEVCDRILIIASGKKIAEGTIKEINCIINSGISGESEDYNLEDVFIKITEKNFSAGDIIDENNN